MTQNEAIVEWDRRKSKTDQGFSKPAVISEDTALLQTFYDIPTAMGKLTPEQKREFIKFRFNFLQEEVNEGLESIEEKDGDGVIDSLIDLIVVSIDTLLLLGVNFDKAWTAVYNANMSKQVGIKAGRPNPLGLPDLIKSQGWVAPCHKNNLGDFQEALDS